MCCRHKREKQKKREKGLTTTLYYICDGPDGGILDEEKITIYLHINVDTRLMSVPRQYKMPDDVNVYYIYICLVGRERRKTFTCFLCQQRFKRIIEKGKKKMPMECPLFSSTYTHNREHRSNINNNKRTNESRHDDYNKWPAKDLPIRKLFDTIQQVEVAIETKKKKDYCWRLGCSQLVISFL
jgi:hypothetical protein